MGDGLKRARAAAKKTQEPRAIIKVREKIAFLRKSSTERNRDSTTEAFSFEDGIIAACDAIEGALND